MNAFEYHHRAAIKFGYSCFDHLLGRGVCQAERPGDRPTARHVRRHEWVEPYYQQLRQSSRVAVILRCRERARVAISYASRHYEVDLATGVSVQVLGVSVQDLRFRADHVHDSVQHSEHRTHPPSL
jgi:hypothetical protein